MCAVPYDYHPPRKVLQYGLAVHIRQVYSLRGVLVDHIKMVQFMARGVGGDGLVVPS
jgi:hypothetical protein